MSSRDGGRDGESNAKWAIGILVTLIVGLFGGAYLQSITHFMAETKTVVNVSPSTATITQTATQTTTQTTRVTTTFTNTTEISRLQKALQYDHVIVSGNVVTTPSTIPFEIQFQANGFIAKGHLENGQYEVVLPNHFTYTVIINYQQGGVGASQCVPKESPWILNVNQTALVQPFTC